MEGLHFKKEAWKYTDAKQTHFTPCRFDDPDVDEMVIGFAYHDVEARREDFHSVMAMTMYIESIERLMQKAFNQGRNHQAMLINAALTPQARPTF